MIFHRSVNVTFLRLEIKVADYTTPDFVEM